MEMKKNEEGSSQVPIRIPNALRAAIESDAQKSGWTLSEQIRFELAALRGMWKQPHMPTSGSPLKKSA